MKTEGPTERQPQVATSAVVCDEVPMKKYVAIVTASIVVEGFDSDDAAQAWKVSRVLHDLKKHGWTAHVDVCSHTQQAHRQVSLGEPFGAADVRLSTEHFALKSAENIEHRTRNSE